MRQRSSHLRYIVAGFASMVAGAVLLVGALPGNAGATAQQEPTPSSSVVSGNPNCGDLGDFAFEFKINAQPVEGQVYDDPNSDLVVTITDVTPGNPITFSFTTNIPVSAVFVKAGPGGILYTFEPPTTVGTDLASPKDSISHVSFCWNEQQETTSTTSSTTSTTVEDTTSTTVGESTTTTAGAVSPTTTPTGELPRTGSTTGPMLGIGAGLLAGGAALVGFARRFRHS
jgi:LPXTG-motif cell wall-anchored protein